MVLSLSRSDSGRKLSENFSVGEFACKCGKCEKILVDEALVHQLQRIRDHFGRGVVINSGHRCAAHNVNVGGAANSKHMEGMAADIQISGITSRRVAEFAESIGIKQIGLYDGFVHVGSGSLKSFWSGADEKPLSTFLPVADVFAVELPVLMENNTGEAVKSLQLHLIGMGYNCGESGADGVFGPATEKALMQYQASVHLTPDGIAGPNTRRRMLGVK